MAGFIFSADWHLSRLTWQHRPRVTGDSFFALAQIVDYAIQHGLALIGAGDLLDKDRPDPAAVLAMCQQMDRMQRAGLPVYYIQGQHERADPPWMSIHTWPTHVHGRAFEIAGYKLYGLDWQPAGQFEQAVRGIPAGTDFLVAHQVWMEHMGNVVAIPEATVHSVPVPVILTGDYHQHQITEHATPLCATRVKLVSCGSISMRNITEPPQKAFWHVHDGVFTSVPLRGRPYVGGPVATMDALDALLAPIAEQQAGLPAELQEPLVRLLMTPEMVDRYSEVNAKVADAHTWVEEIAPIDAAPDLMAADQTPAPAMAEQTLPEIIAEAITDPQTRADLLTLLNSHEPPRQAVLTWAQAINAGDTNAA